jgi:hypothetical protein
MSRFIYLFRVIYFLHKLFRLSKTAVTDHIEIPVGGNRPRIVNNIREYIICGNSPATDEADDRSAILHCKKVVLGLSALVNDQQKRRHSAVRVYCLLDDFVDQPVKEHTLADTFRTAQKDVLPRFETY